MTNIPNLLDFIIRISVEGGSLSSTRMVLPPLTGQEGKTPQSSSSWKSSVLHSGQKTWGRLPLFWPLPSIIWAMAVNDFLQSGGYWPHDWCYKADTDKKTQTTRYNLIDGHW